MPVLSAYWVKCEGCGYEDDWALSPGTAVALAVANGWTREPLLCPTCQKED